ncbi:MAG: hypothetical protein QOG38_85, partial [Hyphomicrobiales bacterium]|nr:hypothetical protein [Hyphomicrobiales bacterium]
MAAEPEPAVTLTICLSFGLTIEVKERP